MWCPLMAFMSPSEGRSSGKLGATHYGDISAEHPRISRVLPQVHRRVLEDSRTTSWVDQERI